MLFDTVAPDERCALIKSIVESSRFMHRKRHPEADTVLTALSYIAKERAKRWADGQFITSCGFHSSRVREFLRTELLQEFGEEVLFGTIKYCICMNEVPGTDRDDVYESVLNRLIKKYVPQYMYKKNAILNAAFKE